MSEEIWAQVERRAASGVSGVQADDNDELLRVLLAEAPMNPHRQSGGAMANSGPGMMPPMMMGGGGGGQGGGAGGAVGGGLGGGLSRDAAAGPTMATRGTSPAGSLTEARYEPAPGGGGAAGGGSFSRAVPSGGGDGADIPESVEAMPAVVETPNPVATDPGPADTPPAEPTSAAPQPHDGFVTDPAAVTSMAVAWNDLSQRLTAVDRAATEARLGLVEGAVRPQQAVNDLMHTWVDGAVREASAMEAKLRDAVKEYAAVDADAISDIRRELPT